MKKVLMIAIPLLLIGGAVAYFYFGRQTSPTFAYYKTVQAAKLGEMDEFYKGFTKKSAKLVRAVMVLSEASGFIPNPTRYLVYGEVLDETIKKIKTKDEKVFELEIPEDAEDDSKEPPKEFELAIVRVRTGRAKAHYILMVQEDKQWKIDAWRLERFQKDPRYREFVLGKKAKK
ncbi:MAG: hypothetical protein KC609_08500 [Myxococcales bacterium]|nr:hypothetical protein [Myxococcales bacterium]